MNSSIAITKLKVFWLKIDQRNRSITKRRWEGYQVANYCGGTKIVLSLYSHVDEKSGREVKKNKYS